MYKNWSDDTESGKTNLAPKRALRVANSVWKRQDIKKDFKAAYREYISKNYGAEYNSFTRDNAVAKINSSGAITGCNTDENAVTVRITGSYSGVTPSVSGFADLEVAGAEPGPGPGPGPGPDPDPVLTDLTFNQSHYALADRLLSIVE